MKRIFEALVKVFAIGCNTILPVSCELLGTDTAGEDGKLRITFTASDNAFVRSVADIPDTNDFILKVADSEGRVVYEGLYGDSPESIIVNPGTYTVTAVSADFIKPAFASPQFGDEQCVVVPSAAVTEVRLMCRQMNCGVRLDIDPSFLTCCPDAALFLKSSQGKLMYSYTEDRIAYFNPGSISLWMSRAAKDELLLTRNLKAQEILVLKVSVADLSAGSAMENISVSVDTSRVWLEESYVIGGDAGKGDDAEDALNVAQAMASAARKDVWLSGYIVGGDLSSASASFEKPFSSRTAILLGSRSSSEDRSSCIAVQLPSGNLRDALNLVDNPSLLGRKLLIRGDLVESYYGIRGLKSCDDYRL